MAEHARISPSSFGALAECPGRLNAIEALPPEQRGGEETQASKDGTRRHRLLEWKCHHAEKPWPTEVGGEPVTSDDVAAVKAVWSYLEKHPARQLGVGRLFYSELRIEIGSYLGYPEGLVFGTADVAAVYPGTVEIADAKFGGWLVDPDSWQLRLYALGFLPTLMEKDFQGQYTFKPEYAQTKTIKLTILQPKAPEVVRSVTFPLEKIGAWMNETRQVVDAALKPDALRVPGESQCKFCPAAATCPERRATVVHAVEDMFEKETGTVEAPAPIASVDAIADIAEVKMQQDPGELSPEELSRILDQASLIEGWLADVRKLANDRLKAGKPVPGWKLIEGKRSREWTLEEGELLAEFKKMGLSKQASYVHKLLTPAQAEKVEKIAGSKKYRQRLGELWRYKAGKPTLVPESDPAPAVDAAHPQEMFEPVEPDLPDCL